MRLFLASLALLLLYACSSSSTSSSGGGKLTIKAEPLKSSIVEEEALVMRFRFQNGTDSTLALKAPTIHDWQIKVDNIIESSPTANPFKADYYLLPSKADTVFTLDFPSPPSGINRNDWTGKHQLHFEYKQKDGSKVATNAFELTIDQLSQAELAARELYETIKTTNNERVNPLAEQFLSTYPNSIYTNKVKLRLANSLIYVADKQKECIAMLNDLYANSSLREERIEAATYLSHILNREGKYREMYKLWKPLDSEKAKKFKAIVDAMDKANK